MAASEQEGYVTEYVRGASARELLPELHRATQERNILKLLNEAIMLFMRMGMLMPVQSRNDSQQLSE